MLDEHNVTILLDDHNGDPFEVAEIIDKQYGRSLITEEEAFAMLDALTKYF